MEDKYTLALEEFKITGLFARTCYKYHIGYRKFYKILAINNLEVINYHNMPKFDENIFEIINTEEKAYWLGFMYADGYVSKNNNNIAIALQLNDFSHLVKFNSFIKNTKPVKLNNICCKIQIANKKTRQDLINKGCIPQKSLKLIFPNEKQVPNNLIRHFVRGYIDGDGSIGVSPRQGKGGYVVGHLQVIGTPEFITRLREVMDWPCLKLHKDKRWKGNTVFITYNSKHVVNMLDNLYGNASVYLDRKYKKYIELGKWRSGQKCLEL